MDTTVRTLRLEISGAGGGGAAIPLAVPVQQEVAGKTSMPLFPKNRASHLLRG